MTKSYVLTKLGMTTFTYSKERCSEIATIRNK